MSTKAFVTAPKTPLAPIRAVGAVCVRNYLSRLSLSTSLGSANKIKYLLQDCQLVSNNCPINVYAQAWTLMMTMPYARCAGDCQRICTGQRCANKYPRLARAEIPTQHIFGV